MPANTPNRSYTYPLYSDPMDFPAQIQDLATDIDTDVTALTAQIAAAQERPSVRVTSGTSQNITTGVATNLIFTTTDYDNDTMTDFTSGVVLNDRGVYWITGRATFNAFGSGGTFYISTAINSSAGFIPVSSRTTMRGHATQPSWISISSLHYTTGGAPDHITLQVLQDSGNTLVCTFKNLCATKISNTIGGT